MQTSVSIAWLLACACSLEAQITSTLNRLPIVPDSILAAGAADGTGTVQLAGARVWRA